MKTGVNSEQHRLQGTTRELFGAAKQYGPMPGTKWQSPLRNRSINSRERGRSEHQGRTKRHIQLPPAAHRRCPLHACASIGGRRSPAEKRVQDEHYFSKPHSPFPRSHVLRGAAGAARPRAALAVARHPEGRRGGHLARRARLLLAAHGALPACACVQTGAQ